MIAERGPNRTFGFAVGQQAGGVSPRSCRGAISGLPAPDGHDPATRPADSQYRCFRSPIGSPDARAEWTRTTSFRCGDDRGRRESGTAPGSAACRAGRPRSWSPRRPGVLPGVRFGGRVNVDEPRVGQRLARIRRRFQRGEANVPPPLVVQRPNADPDRRICPGDT